MRSELVVLCALLMAGLHSLGAVYPSGENPVLGQNGRYMADLFNISGKLYYINDMIRHPHRNALDFCAGIGMRLLVLETPGEYEILHRWLTNNLGYEHWLWTSAWYDLDTYSYVWTSDNSTLDWGGAWAQGFPRRQDSDCSAVSLYENGWWDEFCELPNGVVCEEIPSRAAVPGAGGQRGN